MLSTVQWYNDVIFSKTLLYTNLLFLLNRPTRNRWPENLVTLSQKFEAGVGILESFMNIILRPNLNVDSDKKPWIKSNL